MNARKKILWLASWFPNRLDPLDGDFIERHAQAASVFNDIYVLHVLKDEGNLTGGKVVSESIMHTEHYRSRTIYYKKKFTRLKWLEAIYSNCTFLKCFISALRSYIKENGKPYCIHVHIGFKAGLVAVLAKWFYKTPYIVSEQWTGLCPEASPNFDDLNWVFRKLWRYIMKRSSACSAVSGYLGKAMQKRFSLASFSVIPNVVNIDIFYPAQKTTSPFYFIHVSTLNYQKNPEQFFEAIALLKTKAQKPFKVLIFGEAGTSLKELASRLGITDQVEFKGIHPQPVLSGFMQHSHALVLYSRFETFGCVIIEANACGLPVIVSDIPVLHENVQEGITGTFVPLNDPEALAAKMMWMMQEKTGFDNMKIAELTRNKYSYSIVGKQFDLLYDQLAK